MQRDGKNLKLAGSVLRLEMRCMYVALAGTGAGQRMSRMHLGRKDDGSAVAVMDVAVHRHGASDLAVFVQLLDGHGNVMNHAEAFAMAGKCMMKASANVHANAAFHGKVRCQASSALGKSEC